MLSILIPIYNIDVFPLASSLFEQLNDINIKYEIICIDDASIEKFDNDSCVKKNKNCSFISLEKNIGRSRIRNLLATKAKYNWLLFLDADTLPTHRDFLKNYIGIIKRNPKEHIISGGLSYRLKDAGKEHSLRFKYGSKRESINAEKRKKNPYTSLLMSNTLVRKEVFDKVIFNEKITLYGHEDAVFSFDLFGASFLVKHIDNMVYHTGLESNAVFIRKTKIAVKNLWYLYMQSLIHPEINKLLRSFIQLKRMQMAPLLSLVFKRYHVYFEKQLSKENPSLALFDFYRLSFLCHVSKIDN